MKWADCQFLYKMKLKNGIMTRCLLGTSMEFDSQCRKENCMFIKIYNKIVEDKKYPKIKKQIRRE